MNAIKEAMLSAAGTAFILLMAVLWYGIGSLIAIIGLFKFPLLFPLWIWLGIVAWFGDH